MKNGILSHRGMASAWLVLGILMLFPTLFAVLDRDAVVTMQSDGTSLSMVYGSLGAQAAIGAMVAVSAAVSLKRPNIHASLVVFSLLAVTFAVLVTWFIAPSPIGAVGYIAVAAPVIILGVCASLTSYVYIKVRE